MDSGSDNENSPTADELNVVNAAGVWALLRDHLIANPIAGLPRWLVLDFVRIRRELHAEDGGGSAALDDLDAVYLRLANQCPELDPEALEQLIGLECSLSQRCSARTGSNASSLSPYTKSFFSDETISFFQLYGGAIENCVRNESRPEAAYKLGASLTGPLFFGYVHQLMRQAVADGVTCLYFLARDGQILLEIAKIIKLQLGFDLELRYLYVSRNATRFASLLRMGGA